MWLFVGSCSCTMVLSLLFWNMDSLCNLYNLHLTAQIYVISPSLSPTDCIWFTWRRSKCVVFWPHVLLINAENLSCGSWMKECILNNWRKEQLRERQQMNYWCFCWIFWTFLNPFLIVKHYWLLFCGGACCCIVRDCSLGAEIDWCC